MRREIRINGEPVHPKGRYVLRPGDRVTTLEAGGGGYGDPRKRRKELIRADVEAGFISDDAARREYGATRE
jgi:N-methylhydantoinase B